MSGTPPIPHSPAPPDTAALDLTLDLKGLKCPLPALHTRRALRRMTAGGRLTVSCTDPMAVIDIPNAAREAAASVESRAVDAGIITFVLRKGAPEQS